MGEYIKKLKLREECDTILNNKVVEWPSEGWTLRLNKVPEFQHCFIFLFLSGRGNSEEKRRGAFKSKQEARGTLCLRLCLRLLVSCMCNSTLP